MQAADAGDGGSMWGTGRPAKSAWTGSGQSTERSERRSSRWSSCSRRRGEGHRLPTHIPKVDGATSGALGTTPSRFGPGDKARPQVGGGALGQCPCLHDARRHWITWLGGMRSIRRASRCTRDCSGRDGISGIFWRYIGLLVYNLNNEQSSTRVRALGPVQRHCRQCTDEHWERQHTLSRWEGTQAWAEVV